MKPQRGRKIKKADRPVSHCRDEVGLIGDYLSDNLSQHECQAFEKHLNGCRDCGAFLATYKKTIEMTRNFLRGYRNNQPQPHLQLRRSQ